MTKFIKTIFFKKLIFNVVGFINFPQICVFSGKTLKFSQPQPLQKDMNSMFY